MRKTISISAVAILYIALVVMGCSRSAGEKENVSGQEAEAGPQAFLRLLEGSWEGTCRTWFRPGELADESPVRGEFRFLPGGPFLRHTYEGEMQGKPRRGEETIAYNLVMGMVQMAWMDDFHMNYGILFSQGEAAENGFSVLGEYATGPGEPAWGWKTVYELKDQNNLTITAYNILPDGREARAVETRYIRKKP